MARFVIRKLERVYPDPKCALHHENTLELLVATVLSAQCTDARVNMVTPQLFQTYRSAQDYANADLAQLESIIRSTGFFRSKAKSLKGIGQKLVEFHDGEVPSKMEDLVRLPGVGRKTANVVLGNAFGLTEGIVVDTHVKRVSNRLGLTTSQDPIKIEQDLMKVIPRRQWISFSHWLILHGRQTCKAPKPLCGKCPLAEKCPSARVK